MGISRTYKIVVSSFPPSKRDVLWAKPLPHGFFLYMWNIGFWQPLKLANDRDTLATCDDMEMEFVNNQTYSTPATDTPDTPAESTPTPEPTSGTTISWYNITNVPEIYSKEEIDRLIGRLDLGQPDWNENNATKHGYIKNKPTIPTIPANVSAFNNDAGYLTEHQSLEGYATQEWVNGRGFLTSHQSLTLYATRAWVQGKIAEAKLAEQGGDVFNASQYYTKEEIDNKRYLTSHQSLAPYALKEELEDYALKSELFSGSYNDLTNKPALFSGNYNDLVGKPGFLLTLEQYERLLARIQALEAQNNVDPTNPDNPDPQNPNPEEPSTTYYWYVGTTKPVSLLEASVVESYQAEQVYTNNSGAKAHIFVLTASDKNVKFINIATNNPVTQMAVDTTTISGYKIFETAVGTANTGSIKIIIS